MLTATWNVWWNVDIYHHSSLCVMNVDSHQVTNPMQKAKAETNSLSQNIWLFRQIAASVWRYIQELKVIVWWQRLGKLWLASELSDWVFVWTCIILIISVPLWSLFTHMTVKCRVFSHTLWSWVIHDHDKFYQVCSRCNDASLLLQQHGLRCFSK